MSEERERVIDDPEKVTDRVVDKVVDKDAGEGEDFEGHRFVDHKVTDRVVDRVVDDKSDK